jgi:nitrogen-specific signal transduction histidine kinase
MGSLATEQTDVRQTDARNDATDEILSRLAHELRQPLSNIEAVAYYLSMILPPGDKNIQAQLARIRELVEQSSLILSAALSLAPPPPAAEPRPVPPPA